MPLLYISDASEFFTHIDDVGFDYVVMRNFQQFEHSYPAYSHSYFINEKENL